MANKKGRMKSLFPIHALFTWSLNANKESYFTHDKPSAWSEAEKLLARNKSKEMWGWEKRVAVKLRGKLRTTAAPAAPAKALLDCKIRELKNVYANKYQRIINCRRRMMMSYYICNVLEALFFRPSSGGKKTRKRKTFFLFAFVSIHRWILSGVKSSQ